jgi:hypothetical protein
MNKEKREESRKQKLQDDAIACMCRTKQDNNADQMKETNNALRERVVHVAE